jgi:hypothetical protein
LRNTPDVAVNSSRSSHELYHVGRTRLSRLVLNDVCFGLQAVAQTISLERLVSGVDRFEIRKVIDAELTINRRFAEIGINNVCADFLYGYLLTKGEIYVSN